MVIVSGLENIVVYSVAAAIAADLKPDGALLTLVSQTRLISSPPTEPTSVEPFGEGGGEGGGLGGGGECPPCLLADPPNIVETGPSSVIRMSGLAPDECADGLSSS